MVFSSLTFIYVFLPLTLLCYYLSPVKAKNYVLLFFSFCFYAWGEPKAFFVMLAVILLNYCFSLFISRFDDNRTARTMLLALDLIGNLGILFYFKYIDFTIKTFNHFFNRDIGLLNIALPIGISFFIFQALSYTIDVFRKDCEVQKNPFKLALYISLFPQLIAGPIVKYHDIELQIDNRHIGISDFSAGIRRFILGLGKKVLIANICASVVDDVFSSFLEVNSLTLWVGALAYSLQIYYDFSGYSDMAIGLGKMFGFTFLENFNYPYISSSITEFWRRWHISLSTWFKEYVYIPLGGNRCSKVRNLFNIFVVFLLTGIWHGAAWVFILWGLWHGFFNMFEKVTGLNKVGKDNKNVCIKIIMHIYTIVAVFFGWIIFRSVSVKSAVKYILAMFNLYETIEVYSLAYFVSTNSILVILVGILFSMPIFKLLQEKVSWLKNQGRGAFVLVNVLEIIFYLGIFVLCAALLAGNTYNPFIYFRF